MAGSVASRANTSLASALNRNLSEIVIIVMLRVYGGSAKPSVTDNCPRHGGDTEPTLQAVMGSKFVSNIAHPVVIRENARSETYSSSETTLLQV
jgi:hypothetical protein